MVPYNWISLGALHQINPALGMLKDLSVTNKRAILIPKMSQNHYLTKFILTGEVHRIG